LMYFVPFQMVFNQVHAYYRIDFEVRKIRVASFSLAPLQYPFSWDSLPGWEPDLPVGVRVSRLRIVVFDTHQQLSKL